MSLSSRESRPHARVSHRAVQAELLAAFPRLHQSPDTGGSRKGARPPLLHGFLPLPAAKVQHDRSTPRTSPPPSSPTSAPRFTHLNHLAKGDGAVGCDLGERRWLEGRQPLGRLPSEHEGLGACHLERVGNQASKQDHEGVAGYSREEASRVKASCHARSTHRLLGGSERCALAAHPSPGGDALQAQVPGVSAPAGAGTDGPGRAISCQGPKQPSSYNSSWSLGETQACQGKVPAPSLFPEPPDPRAVHTTSSLRWPGAAPAPRHVGAGHVQTQPTCRHGPDDQMTHPDQQRLHLVAPGDVALHAPEPREHDQASQPQGGIPDPTNSSDQCPAWEALHPSQLQGLLPAEKGEPPEAPLRAVEMS